MESDAAGLPVMPKLLMPGAVAAALGTGLLLRWAGSQNVRALVESAGIRLMAALRCYLKLLPAAVFCLTVGPSLAEDFLH